MHPVEVARLPPTRTRTPKETTARRPPGDAARDRIVAPPRENEPRMTFIAPRANPAFETRLKADLSRIRNAPVMLESRATNHHDGRRDRVVLLLARAADGSPVPGLLARVLQGEQLRDHSRTDKRGVAVLLVPTTPGAHDHDHDAMGRIEVLLKDRPSLVRDVVIPAGRQHRVMEIVIDPPLVTEVPVTTAESPEPIRRALDRVIDLMDNPLDRLPADFSTELCEDLKRFLGPVEDPILGGHAGADDFRQRRIPLIRRLTIPRLGELKADKSPPRRYLVRVRQEWTFLGYSLGELSEVDALDPGAIIKEGSTTVDRALQTATRAVDTLVQHAAESVSSSLNQNARIENVVRVATSVKTRAAAGGFGFALPFIAGGAVGATASVSSTTAVRTRTDTSLEVNASLQVAKSLVNEAVSSIQTSQRDVKRTVTRALSQVSPLLSRVTNLLRWTLYENYMVCTHVEDVLEVEPVQVANLFEPGQNGLLFTDEQIVDLRRIFETNLLEPSLRRRFDALAAAVEARRGSDLPITAVQVSVEYNTRYGGSINVTIGPNEDQTTIRLPRGGGRVTQTIRMNTPLDDSAITSMRAELTSEPADMREMAMAAIRGISLPPGSSQVTRIELGFVTASGYVRRFSLPFGSELTATDDEARVATPPISVPAAPIFTSADPLLVHINKNKTYYFGLLAQAALVEPALRDDMPHFDAFDGSHEIWSLPIVGFEGNKALVVKEADRTLKEVQELMKDPGAATLIQLAAPGAYAEALQGLLKLAVDTERIHPALEAPLAPVMAPLAVVDLTGKTVPLPIGTGPAPAPTPTPVPLPSP